MVALTFDTHAFVKELTAAGFSESQAEAVTSVVRRTREVDTAGIASKADLAATEARLDSRISQSGSDLLKWIIGMIGFQALTLFAGALAIAKLVH